MTFRYITSIAAGLLLLVQTALAFAVGGNLGKATTWVGDGGDATLLELSGFSPRLLLALCAAFPIARPWAGLSGAGAVQA